MDGYELGQDVERVERVLETLLRQQRVLAVAHDRVQDAAAQLTVAWKGPDAARGIKRARSSATTARLAADSVEEMARALRGEVDAQRSANGFGAGAGAGTPDPTTPAPTTPTDPSPTPGRPPADVLSDLAEPGATGTELERRRLAARELFESLSPEEAHRLAVTHPFLVGSLPGVPFEYRADANAFLVRVALDDERDELAALREQDEANEHDRDFLGLNNDDLDDRIAELEKRTALYESILRDDRQILVFDPSGDGAIAELHGPIGPQTRNVGVLVPGTGADLASFAGDAKRSLSFQDYDVNGRLSMVTWLGGDLPDDILRDAPSASYSIDLGPRLADFSRDLALEIHHSQSPGTQVTVAGHSYGGAVVGRGELEGLVADRVLHIESAGMGHDVWDAGDLPASQAGVDRYSMTAPGDLIGLSQGLQVGDVGHGGDPDDFPGTVRLDTGDKTDGSINRGKDSHSEVFQSGSDAWRNMYEVFTGGTVETYRTPETEPFLGTQTGWADDGQRIDIR